MKKNKKKFLIIGILLVVIGLGYAFLNANFISNVKLIRIITMDMAMVVMCIVMVIQEI